VKIDRHLVLKHAHERYRYFEGAISFGACLKYAWRVAKDIRDRDSRLPRYSFSDIKSAYDGD